MDDAQTLNLAEDSGDSAGKCVLRSNVMYMQMDSLGPTGGQGTGGQGNLVLQQPKTQAALSLPQHSSAFPILFPVWCPKLV